MDDHRLPSYYQDIVPDARCRHGIHPFLRRARDAAIDFSQHHSTRSITEKESYYQKTKLFTPKKSHIADRGCARPYAGKGGTVMPQEHFLGFMALNFGSKIC